MNSPWKGVNTKKGAQHEALELEKRNRRKTSRGDGRKVDREIRGKSKECNVPETEREGPAARGPIRWRQENAQ